MKNNYLKNSRKSLFITAANRTLNFFHSDKKSCLKLILISIAYSFATLFLGMMIFIMKLASFKIESIPVDIVIFAVFFLMNSNSIIISYITRTKDIDAFYRPLALKYSVLDSLKRIPQIFLWSVITGFFITVFISFAPGIGRLLNGFLTTFEVQLTYIGIYLFLIYLFFLMLTFLIMPVIFAENAGFFKTLKKIIFYFRHEFFNFLGDMVKFSCGFLCIIFSVLSVYYFFDLLISSTSSSVYPIVQEFTMLNSLGIFNIIIPVLIFISFYLNAAFSVFYYDEKKKNYEGSDLYKMLIKADPKLNTEYAESLEMLEKMQTPDINILLNLKNNKKTCRKIFKIKGSDLN